MKSTTWDPNSPSLRKAIICYADILGFRAETKRAFASGEATQFLRRIKGALDVAYGKVREAQNAGGTDSSIFDMKVFTDNVVVAYPVHDQDIELGEGELGIIMMLFSEVQASLAADGFLIRGAIAFGDHYQDDDIAYGPALFRVRPHGWTLAGGRRLGQVRGWAPAGHRSIGRMPDSTAVGLVSFR